MNQSLPSLILYRWAHEGLLSKCFTNNRLRKTLESRNLELYKKIDEVKQILQAMVVAEKKRLGNRREEAAKQSTGRRKFREANLVQHLRFKPEE